MAKMEGAKEEWRDTRWQIKTFSLSKAQCVASLAVSSAILKLEVVYEGVCGMSGHKKKTLVFPSLLFLSKDRLSSAHKDIVGPQSEDFRVCQCVKWEGRQSSSTRRFGWGRPIVVGGVATRWAWPHCEISKAVVLG